MKKKSASTTRNDRLASKASAFFAYLVLAFLASACSTFESRIREPSYLFEAGRYDEAAIKFKELVDKKDNDYLLYTLNLGIVYHTAGKYKEAIETFLLADKLAEIKDYTSIAAESAAILLNDTLKDYRAEHFEVVLIHVYLAMDFLLSGNFEGALVECRKVNHILDRMIAEGKLPYEHNAFAKYLAASIFESEKEYNDAFVDYRQMEKWAGNFPYLPGPLLRLADRLKNLQELEEYKTKYPEAKKDYKLKKGEGEVILLVEQGRAPHKVPLPGFEMMPKFVRSGYGSEFVWIRDKEGKHKTQSYPLFDIEQTAIKELSHRTGGIIAKKVAGIAVKSAVGYGVAKLTKSEDLGILTAALLMMTDRADLRSWTTLPARLQLARLSLPAGRHELVADTVFQGGNSSPGAKVFSNVEVKAGRTTFLHYRTW